jgi:hypothetical protein
MQTTFGDNFTQAETISDATTPVGRYPWVHHILERDPTWAKDFNPRKIRTINNMVVPKIVEKAKQ